MITGQIIAVSIMFAITVGLASIMFVPVTCFARKSPVINFYWSGFWGFLALIAAVAGGNSVLMIMGQNDQQFSNQLFTGLIMLYVVFVIVGWFHLSGKAALSMVNKLRS